MRSRESLELPFGDARQVFTVSSLNREARILIEEGLGTIWVEGEISNLSRPSSGHLYWHLKDANAQIRCAMFRQHNRALDFTLANGQQIVVRARVTLYESRGEFQLVVDYVEEAGVGLLAAALRGAQTQARRRRALRLGAQAPTAAASLADRRRHVAERRGAARRADRAAPPLPRDPRADLSDQRARRRRGRRDCTHLAPREPPRRLRSLDSDSRRRLARGPLGVQRGSRRARDRGRRHPGDRRRRPRDRFHDRRFCRGSARARRPRRPPSSQSRTKPNGSRICHASSGSSARRRGAISQSTAGASTR